MKAGASTATRGNTARQTTTKQSLAPVAKQQDKPVKFSVGGKDVELSKIDCSTLKYYRHQIFRRDYLFQREGRYKGNTLRTHAGGAWLDGYSDHLPTVVYVVKEAK